MVYDTFFTWLKIIIPADDVTPPHQNVAVVDRMRLCHLSLQNILRQFDVL